MCYHAQNAVWCSCHADISLSANEYRVSSCRTWDALTLPDYKDATAANKAPFNIEYDTNLDYFQYVSSERQDIGNRAKKAMAGKGFNLGQYLNRKLSSPIYIHGQAENPLVYPWASEKNAHIVDVGGGIGSATLPILRAFSDLRLTVQDLPDSAPEFQEVCCPHCLDVRRPMIRILETSFLILTVLVCSMLTWTFSNPLPWRCRYLLLTACYPRLARG